MNDLIQKIAVDSGLMNYVDLETPRRYFVHAHIEEGDIELFASRCVRGALCMLEQIMREDLEDNPKWSKALIDVENAFREDFPPS